MTKSLFKVIRTLKLKEGLRVFVLFIVSSPVFSQTSDLTLQRDYEDAVKLLNLDSDLSPVLNAFLDVYARAENKNNYKLSAESAKYVSYLYRTTGLYSEAIDFAKKSLENSLKLPDTLFISQQYSNLAKTYFYCATSEEVQDDRTKLFLDSTLTNYEEVLILLESLDSNEKNTRELLIAAYTNLSSFFYETDNFEQSKKFANDALNSFENDELSHQKAYLFNTLGNINLSNEEYLEAKENYIRALENYPPNIDEKYTDIMTRGDFYVNLSWAKRNLDDISSYEDLDEGVTLRERADGERVALKLMKTTTDFKGKLKIVAEQEKKETLQKFLLLLGLLAVFIIGTLFTLYKATQLKQKNLELQIEKDQLLQKSEVERLDKLSQRKVLNATIDGRESERKLIAEILHDSVSSLLSSANLHLQASRSVYDDIPLEIEKSQRIISEASDKIRNLSHELISSVLLKFGLSYSIFDLCEKYSNSQIELVSDINNIQRYEQAFEIKINNIIEELVNNILKHSNASESIISLEQKDKDLHIEITDNGDGFKLDQAVLKDGLGLNQIKARVAMMEGSIHIDSVEGFGTTINIEVPIVERPITKREVV